MSLPVKGVSGVWGVRTTLLVLCLALLLGTIAAYTVVLARFSANAVREQADGQLTIAAQLAREIVGADFHDRLQTADSLAPETYAEIVERFSQLCWQLDLQYLWSVLESEAGLVFTSATRINLLDPDAGHAAFFELHRDPDAFVPARESEPEPAYASFHNEWGEGRMVLIPYRDQQGRLYMFGASMQLSEYHNQIATARRTATKIGLVILAIGCIPVILVARRLSLPIISLTEAADQMAAGTLTQDLAIEGPREWISLAHSLDRMQIQLDEQMRSLRRSEAMLKAENEVLAKVVSGVDLTQILTHICRFGESLDANIKVSVLLYDTEQNQLVHAAGPSLSEDYTALMRAGVPIGPNVGSCGTSAFLKKRVVAADIQHDPKWTAFPEYVAKTRQQGFRACWSQPILTGEDTLLGTIANYAVRSGDPSEHNLRILEWSAHIAALAIENRRSANAVAESGRRLKSYIDHAPYAFFICDHAGRYLEVNPAASDLTGYTQAELLSMSIADLLTHSAHQKGAISVRQDWAIVHTCELAYHEHNGLSFPSSYIFWNGQF